jgi:hypothetical protein
MQTNNTHATFNQPGAWLRLWCYAASLEGSPMGLLKSFAHSGALPEHATVVAQQY